MESVGETITRAFVLCEDNPLVDKIDEAIRDSVSKEDYDVVHRKLRPLAEQGDANSQVFLGTLFHDGCGTAKNVDEAARLYRCASDQNHPVAQLLLAFCYRDGDGVRKDWNKMMELQLKAANQGYATALYSLAAYHYFTGSGSHAEAYKWARLAALRLKLAPHKHLMESVIEEVRNVMTPEELVEADRLVSDWKPKRQYT